MEVKRVFRVPESRPKQLSGRISEELIGIVHQALGSAAGCWSNTDGASVFDIVEIGNIAFELCSVIADEIEAERDAACGYIETTTKRECSSILRLSEVAVTDESEEDLIIQDRACWEGDIR